MINWLQDWYKNQCNDEWEHDYGITIGTLDNPGWDVKIDLIGTSLEGFEIPITTNEISDDDWITYRIENNTFIAAGDPGKLEKIILIFKQLFEAI